MKSANASWKDLTMPVTEEELKKFIKDYLEENLKVTVYTDFCCDDKEIVVKLLLGDEDISTATEYL